MTTTHANERTLEDIANKIAALEAMTLDNANTTQNEIENATALIQKLLTKYNLDIETARKLSANDPRRQSETPIEIQYTPNHGDRRFEWEEVLAHNIARAMYCKIIYYPSGYNFIGAPHDIRTAVQTFNRLRPVIMIMATNATKEYTNHWRNLGVMDTRMLKGEHSIKSYKLSYLNGVVSGIGQALAESRRESDTAAAGAVTALVVVRDVAITAKIKATWPKLGKARAGETQYNAEAYTKGQHDGRNVPLHQRGELKPGE